MTARISLPTAVLAVVVLAGCQATPGASTGTPGAPAAAAAPANAPARTVHGVATYVERVKMPAGAALQVDVLDAARGTRVGGVRVPDVGGPPIRFEVALPQASSAGYALRATLLGPDGSRWFETPAPVAVVPGGDTELRMRRVAGAAAADAPPTGNVAHWECGELGVMSRFEDGHVRLAFNGASLLLPAAVAASGARYADARGNEFWTKGATGRLALAGEPARDCVQAAQPSPWNQALLHGATFRAVGSEPGWSAEVAGTPPALDAQLDYGERRLHVPLRAAADGYVGNDASGPVRLRIEKTACEDGMSGQRFEARVTLAVGDREYRGCGAYLDD